MTSIGTHKGLYEYVTDKDNIAIENKIKGFYKEAKKEAKTQNGLMVTLPNKQQVFVPVMEVKDNVYIFQKNNIIVEGHNIAEQLRKAPPVKIGDK